MFEFIRTHRRLMQFLLLLIIVPSFAFVWLESYLRMSDRDTMVAKVAGQDISQREWDAAQSRQLERFRQDCKALSNNPTKTIALKGRETSDRPCLNLSVHTAA